jgi:hypothetical protein
MYPSIEKYKELSNRRRNPSFWADNIIQAEKCCQSEEEARHFYMYVLNPKKYKPGSVLTKETHLTLGDLEKANKLFDERKPLPPQLKETVYENGIERIIHVKNIATPVIEEDDEKAA